MAIRLAKAGWRSGETRPEVQRAHNVWPARRRASAISVKPLYQAPKGMTLRTGGWPIVAEKGYYWMRIRPGSVHRNQAIKQSSNQAFLSQRNKEERLSAQRSKDYGASRKNLIKLRAKRNHFPTLWTRSSFLVPL
jgi:hypothetical protein